ncbi:MAG: DUF167 domain-containing protein [Candidatus Hydrothermarchaeota archaeon]
MRGIIKTSEDGILIDIEVIPRSDTDKIIGINEWRKRLEVKIKEAPVKGKANEHVIRLFSKSLGVKPSSVKIVKGSKSRQKTIKIEGNSEIIAKKLKRWLSEKEGDNKD